jgi:protein-tyrosine-phosphatase
MAEGLLKKALPFCNVSSAGIFALSGTGANANAIAVAKEKGIDISAHVARQITQQLITDSDLILCMTKGHTEMLKNEKATTLGEYAGTNEEVVDPFGDDIEGYRRCFTQLEGLTEKIADIISNDNKTS